MRASMDDANYRSSGGLGQEMLVQWRLHREGLWFDYVTQSASLSVPPER